MDSRGFYWNYYQKLWNIAFDVLAFNSTFGSSFDNGSKSQTSA